MTNKNTYCKYCNYTPKRQCDFKKHLLTNKHLKNVNIIINSTEKSDNSTEKSDILLNKQYKYKCKHCNTTYNRSDSYNRHLKNCTQNLLGIINELNSKVKETDECKQYCETFEKLITTQNNTIFELNETIKELKTQNKIDVITTENKLLKEYANPITTVANSNIASSTITNGNKNKIQNITQYIINSFPNAPNVKPIENVDEIVKLITSNSNESYAELIQKHYVEGVEPENRSLWLVDSSRDKYLTRLDNKWNLDIHGTMFCEEINPVISKLINDQVSKEACIHKKFVLLELVVYVYSQKTIPKFKKSNIAIQNIKDWEMLGTKITTNNKKIES